MSIIKAPYNFVPFNKTAVCPHWVNAISHDLPFQDGLSGEIEITLTAQSPIFVKDGMGQEEAKSYKNDEGRQVKDYSFSFSEWHGRYFIPSTSVKGMVRNVLEILTFGKMEEKVNDHKYALRDLSSKMKEIYLKPFKPDKIFCGWLIKKEDSYIIIDCGLPGRISHKELDKTLGTEFVEFTTKADNFSTQNKSNKSAQKKYALLGDRDQLYSFTKILNNDPRDMYAFDSLGAKKGRLVFTGQPGVRKNINGKWTGHHLEFIFFENGNKIERKVDSKVIDNFLFAYYEHDRTKWSQDWKVWRQKLDNGHPIPVFFQKDGDEIIHLGLSYLYKLPYNYSVRDSIRINQQVDGLDMSEAIFGHVQKNDALKGRVTFSHAFATVAEADELKHEVLAAPKASYYPNYIRQELRNGNIARGTYQTFMNQRAEIAGWKRYPIRSNVSSNAGTDNVKTRFVPLKRGAQFKCKIYYHNLRPVELGALLSALTFHNTQDTFHNVGMAKSLGYGKVKLNIDQVGEVDVEQLIGEFEAYMNAYLNHNEPKWHQSSQIVELITMAQEHSNVALEYMRLQDHVTAKNDGEALDKYSALNGVVRASINPLCNAAKITRMKEQIGKESGINLHQNYLPELISITKTKAQSDLENAFEARKKKLLQQLQYRKQALTEAEHKAKEDQELREREAKKIQIQMNAAQSGPAFNSVVVGKKNSFKQLENIVADFGRKFHKTNDKGLRDNFPDGYLPIEYHDSLLKKLYAIYEALKAADKDKWKEPFDQNHILKKVATWIGEEKTRGLKF